MRWLVSLFFFPYRYFLSPVVHLLAGPGMGCRFQPSCGDYAQEALAQFGFFRGFALALRRISRCHPFGGSGYDPVPVVSPDLIKKPPVEGA